MKRHLLLLTAIFVAVLLTAMPSLVLGQGSGDGPAPPPPVTPDVVSPSVDAPQTTNYSSGTTSARSTQTGSELLLLGVAGAALIGSGYFLTRKARA